MSFANPLWFLLLGLLPVIVLLHAIAVRWRVTLVSSLALWQEAVNERAMSLRIRRLLGNLALLLELAAVIALSTSLAGPLAPRAGGGGSGSTILVLDATASMQVREGVRTRFDLARSRALDAVAGLRRGDGMAIVLAERSPRLLQPFTVDHATLQRVLRAAVATDEPGDVSDSMAFALSLRDARRGDQVLLVSDGAYESLEGVDLSLPWIHVVLVGSRHDNVGITGFSFRRTPGAESTYEVFCSVANIGAVSVSVPLSIRGEKGIVVTRHLDIAAGARASFGLPWTGPTEGRVEARIETGDTFPLDDAAYAVFAPARTVRVRLAGSGTYFIQKALESLPGLVLSTDAGPESGVEDVSIYDAVDPPDLEKGNIILFASTPPNLPLRVVGNLAAPVVTGWSRSSPLLDSVSLGGLLIGQALSLQPGPGFNVLAASRESPLILSWEQTGLKVIIVAFDPQKSDFPLRPGFPLFLANAITWFLPSWLTLQADQVQTGQPRALTSDSASSSIHVVKPDGTRRALAVSDLSREFRETDEVGFYRVESGSSESEFAANLTSPSETDITPRLIIAGPGSPRGGVRTVGSTVPIWPLLAGFALLFLLAEWLVWAAPHRRPRE